MQQQPENELKEELESQMRSTVLTRAANLFNARLLRSIEEFRIEQGVGEGTYGEVSRSVEISTNTKVALKRVKSVNEKDGFPMSAVREIRLLKTLRHKNIINLRDIAVSTGLP